MTEHSHPEADQQPDNHGHLTAPIGYRCHWISFAGFKPFDAIRPKPQSEDFVTIEDAERQKALVHHRYGNEVACTITPVFVGTKAARARRSSKQPRNLKK